VSPYFNDMLSVLMLNVVVLSVLAPKILCVTGVKRFKQFIAAAFI
jgi:hypothetical protein